MDSEVLCGIKVLVALAKADGHVSEQERLALQDALEAVEASAEVNLAALLESDVHVDQEIAGITSPAARKQTYESACAFVYVDGEANAQERAILEKVRKAFDLGEHGEAKRRFWEELDRALSGEAPVKRSTAVSTEIKSAAIYSAAVAEVPDTTISALLVFANRIAMARNIGLYYGHGGDLVFWKTFVSNIVGAPAPGSALSRLIPGWARTSAGTEAFAATWALGKATESYFEKKEAASPTELRDAFKKGKKEAAPMAKDAADAIAKRKDAFDESKATLDADYASERITRATYIDRLLELD